MTSQTPSKFTAAETVVKFASAAVSVLTTDSLDSLFSTETQVESLFKNVTVTPPEGGVDKIDLLGAEIDADTTHAFQNALLDEKPYGLATFTGTALLNHEGFFEPFIDAGSTTVTTGSDTYDRFRFGALSTASAGRPTIAILAEGLYPVVGTATSKWNVLLNNAVITKLGDYKIGGPDTHWEVDVTAVCLPKDFYLERLR